MGWWRLSPPGRGCGSVRSLPPNPEHIDLDNCVLKVRASMHEVAAKFAGPKGRIFVDAPKTKAAIRTVAFDPVLAPDLAPLVASRPVGESLLRSPKGSLITRN